MAIVHCLGPIELFECSTCKERFTGAREDKATKTWRAKHSQKHGTDSKGRPDWEGF